MTMSPLEVAKRVIDRASDPATAWELQPTGNERLLAVEVVRLWEPTVVAREKPPDHEMPPEELAADIFENVPDPPPETEGEIRAHLTSIVRRCIDAGEAKTLARLRQWKPD